MSNYIVDFEDTLTLEQVQAYCAEKNITIIKHLPTWKNVFIVSADVAPTTDSQLLIVVADHADGEGIKLLGLDVALDDGGASTRTVEIHEEKDWWKVATLNSIDFDQNTCTAPIKGAGSTIYLMDSGIEDTHPEFANTSIINFYSFVDNFTDTTGHGTALASLMVGNTCGLTGATIKVVKMFDENVPTKQSDLLAAFDAIANDYLASGKPTSIVNMSWGFAKNDYINAKIEQLAAMGLFLIAAAGNSGVPIDNITPASIPCVLTVGAFDQTLTPCNFSNYTGSDSITNVTLNETNTGALDIWAPGSQIWSAGLNGTYGYSAGTSQAAALASGALAYNLSQYADTSGKGSDIFTSYNGRRSHDLVKQKYRTYADDSSYEIEFQQTPYSAVYGKDQVLDLSDPKYVNSANRIIVYKTDYNFPANKGTKVTVPSNYDYYEPLADRYVVARLTTTDEWPSWMTVNSLGILEIQSPDITDPYLVVPTINLTQIHRDGTESQQVLKVFVLRNDIDKHNITDFVPADDPILNIALYALCYGPTCSDACGFFSSFCYLTGGKQCRCGT